ncbi:MAG: glycosyltransferase family 87 protein [Gemmataceae bacterium]
MPADLPLLTRLAAAVRATPAGRWRVVGVAVVVGLVVLTNVRYAEKAAKPGRDGEHTRTAVLRWRTQLQGLVGGTNVYRVGDFYPPGPDGQAVRIDDPYPNPPVMGLILYPLVELPPVPAGLVWLNLKIALAAVSLVWAVRLARDATGPPAPGWAVAAAVALSLHPILGDLSHGNVNIFIAFLTVAALELLRRRRDALAGLTLALAIACKVTPALFLPYLVWKRAWKATTFALLGLGLWLLLVPGLALGWGHNRELLTSWFDGMVKPFLVDGKVTSEHANQSLPGITRRLLTAQPSSYRYDEDNGRHVQVPDEYHNLTDVGPDAARWLVRGCQAGFGLAVLLVCRADFFAGGPRQGVRLAAEYSLIALGMLLFSERTWKHHGVVLVLPYAALATFAAVWPLSAGWKGYMWGTLLVVGGLTLGPGALGGDAQDAALTYGSHTAAFLLLTAAVAAVLWHERRS